MLININKLNVSSVEIVLSGSWSITDESVKFPDFEQSIGVECHTISFNFSQLISWDSSLVAFIFNVINFAKKQGIEVNLKSLPKDIYDIIKLSQAVPAKIQHQDSKVTFLANVGNWVLKWCNNLQILLAFIGDIVVLCGKILIGKNKLRLAETFTIIEQCGPHALPIVALIAVLIGLILAFIGAVQLQQFGASIYVANLVGIGMLREMGAIMAAIVMAGRTGAAFAAQLGTMQVNEEVDAFKTFGVSPLEMLVLPRIVALVVMMPLLCVYADILGILGGAVVGVFSLDLDITLFFEQLVNSLKLGDLLVGVFKSVVFGVLIAVSGCLRGIQCARSASAVGDAVTGAVVTSIIAIVATDAAFAVLTNILGI